MMMTPYLTDKAVRNVQKDGWRYPQVCGLGRSESGKRGVTWGQIMGAKNS